MVKVLVAHAEDLGLVHSAHLREHTNTCSSSTRGSDTLFQSLNILTQICAHDPHNILVKSNKSYKILGIIDTKFFKDIIEEITATANSKQTKARIRVSLYHSNKTEWARVTQRKCKFCFLSCGWTISHRNKLMASNMRRLCVKAS